MHEHFGIDLADRKLLKSRSWQWLMVRLEGLIVIDSRISGFARARHEATTTQ